MQTRVRTEGEQPQIVRRFAQQPFFPTLRIVGRNVDAEAHAERGRSDRSGHKYERRLRERSSTKVILSGGPLKHL